MEKLKVLIRNNQREIRIPTGMRLTIRRCCHAVLEHENFEKNVEISISFVNNEEIKKLNMEYRGKDNVTDVLSFPLISNGDFEVNKATGTVVLGDIVISIEKAVAQARTYAHSLEREVAFLTVHSVLHLLGYDHETDRIEAINMREKEEEILTKVGLPRGVNYSVDGK